MSRVEVRGSQEDETLRLYRIDDAQRVSTVEELVHVEFHVQLVASDTGVQIITIVIVVQR